jgi:hypothetical protein
VREARNSRSIHDFLRPSELLSLRARVPQPCFDRLNDETALHAPRLQGALHRAKHLTTPLRQRRAYCDHGMANEVAEVYRHGAWALFLVADTLFISQEVSLWERRSHEMEKSADVAPRNGATVAAFLQWDSPGFDHIPSAREAAATDACPFELRDWTRFAG